MQGACVPTTVCYEQPLNERMRLLLRLEFLFRQIIQTAEEQSEWGSRTALQGLCELLSLTSRNELKAELLKELDRHAAFLSRLKEAPGVDPERLSQILSDIQRVARPVHSQTNLAFEAVRRNDFLSAFCQRHAMTGGTSAFDLPALHLWLKQDSAARARHIEGWLKPFRPLQEAVELILRLVRDSAVPQEEVAVRGYFQKTLDVNAPNQLVRVLLLPEAVAFPEISSGRQRISIRFMKQPDPHRRAVQSSEDIPFQLVCCVI